MDGEAVMDYVEQSQTLLEASPQMNEENTKVKLVQPFLELLGWDLYSTEVALEYTIPMASGSTHVDYALLVGDSPVVFVEAKPVRSSLTDDEIQQLRSYMRQELDVDWGILTNGQSFEVLTKSRDQNGGEEVSVVQFELDDLTENPGVLELLTKESIRSGKSDEVAEQVAATNRAISSLQANEDSVTDAVTEAVENEVGELTIDLEEQAREFIQGLGSVLREQRQFVSDEPADNTEKEPDEADDSSEEINAKRSRIAGKIARSEIEGDGDTRVAVFPTKESGVPFLKENEAWGFVRVGKEFDYVVMYVTDDVREVKYIGRVADIVDPADAELIREPADYKDAAKIADGKKVITFEPGSLHELEDPIPFESKYPQGLRYTTLEKLRTAETTDELL